METLTVLASVVCGVLLGVAIVLLVQRHQHRPESFLARMKRVRSEMPFMLDHETLKDTARRDKLWALVRDMRAEIWAIADKLKESESFRDIVNWTALMMLLAEDRRREELYPIEEEL